jgi:hypothetical protein
MAELTNTQNRVSRVEAEPRCLPNGEMMLSIHFIHWETDERIGRYIRSKILMDENEGRQLYATLREIYG